MGVRVTPAYPAAFLDTSVLIDPPEDIGSYAEQFAVSVVSIAELASGLNVPVDPVERVARQERFAAILSTYRITPYSLAAARRYGALCDVTRESGLNPRPRRFDLLLASVAIQAGLPLLTRNPDDFAHLHRSLVVVPVPASLS
ncbi:MAG: PIN domain-containing protein [Nocardioidaceae bacterium]